jgi:hypothetical protein
VLTLTKVEPIDPIPKNRLSYLKLLSEEGFQVPTIRNRIPQSMPWRPSRPVPDSHIFDTRLKPFKIDFCRRGNMKNKLMTGLFQGLNHLAKVIKSSPTWQVVVDRQLHGNKISYKMDEPIPYGCHFSLKFSALKHRQLNFVPMQLL